eukprot:scaffold27435_cov31-Prasinocladus_malaysianus.AAC.1
MVDCPPHSLRTWVWQRYTVVFNLLVPQGASTGLAFYDAATRRDLGVSVAALPPESHRAAVYDTVLQNISDMMAAGATCSSVRLLQHEDMRQAEEDAETYTSGTPHLAALAVEDNALLATQPSSHGEIARQHFL